MAISKNNTDPTVQWKFDGDKLASEYKKNNPSKAWEGKKKWSDLNDGEKEAVRADFRKKMRNDGLNKVEMDDLYREKLMEDDDKFDELFIIA